MEHTQDPMEETSNSYGPLKIIIGLFLLLLIILMAIPYYSIKTNPEPGHIMTIDEIFPNGTSTDIGNLSILNSKEDYYKILDYKDPVVKYAADRLVVSACEETNRVCYAKAIYYFVRDNFQYVNDPYEYEYVKTAKQSLISRGGDCDDASILMASLLKAVGFEVSFVFEPRHVYIRARIPEAIKRYKNESNWVSLDGTCKSCDFGETPI